MEIDPWAWGWVSIGTLSAAFATVVLAAVTFHLVRRTKDIAKASEADLKAQWRPVLVPTLEDPELAHDSDAKLLSLVVRIRNVGRGPALYVRAQVETPPANDPGGVSPQHWSPGTLAPDDAQELVFRLPKVPEFAQLLLDYRDLADNTHGTSVTITFHDGRPYFYDVHLVEHKVTVLGDAVYPQDGLRSVL
ncbi:hypothetical protein [Streptomyces sp. PR69]|uniref:hypothetical protein n=1 Tax=Streptomyces sp. PR69 TaxID=2984950 RepID=UPI002263E5A1|nr:hypothetical protein [Streptomyces sp. PR69]